MISTLRKDLAGEDEHQTFERRVDEVARRLPCVVFDSKTIPAVRRARMPEPIRNVPQPIIGGERTQGFRWLDCPRHDTTF